MQLTSHVICTLLHLILCAVFALQSFWCVTHKPHVWSEALLCCPAQAAQEQQLQQPCLSFPAAAAWPRWKVLKPKSLSVQQCRAQGSEFLTWSREWRRIWRCVFSLDFSPLCKGFERWFEEELLSELRNGGISGSFLHFIQNFSFSLLTWRAN